MVDRNFKLVIITCLIFNNWSFGHAFIGNVTVAKGKIACAKMSLYFLVNEETEFIAFHVFLILIY